MSVDRRWYIYRHIRRDTGIPFYIGKGATRPNRPFGVERAHVTYKRNTFWKNIVAKAGGFDVEIMLLDLTSEEAQKKEREFIAIYGRRSDGGILCNLTLGGDGTRGLMLNAQERENLSKRFSGSGHPNWGKKLSEETCRKKSEALKGAKHHLYGKKLTQEWKDRIAAAKMGDKNPRFGKCGKESYVAKRVVDEATGVSYYSIREAAESLGIKLSYLYSQLDGSRPNHTTLRSIAK